MTDTPIRLVFDSGEPTEAENLLLSMLAEVRAGRVQGVAIMATYTDGCVGAGWSAECERDTFRALGGIAHLQDRFLREALGK